MAEPLGQQLVHAEAERQREAALFSLGRLDPRVAPGQLDCDVVTVRPRGRRAPSKILLPALGQCDVERTLPRLLVTEADVKGPGGPGEGSVGDLGKRRQLVEERPTSCNE